MSKKKSKVEKKTISFSMEDVILGSEINPSNFTLPMLSEFISQVTRFLRGVGRQDLGEIKTGIKNGSLTIVTEDKMGILDDAFLDYQLLQKSGDLSKLDPLRADVIEEWQRLAKVDGKNRTYKLLAGDKSLGITSFTISSKTNYTSRKEIWVNVDLYLYGRVYDIGGKNKPNVHIELENGKSIKIDARASFLAGDKENRIYKDQLVRIKAKRNILTHELRDEQLVSFEYYNPEFNEEEFDRISRKAKVAWKSIKSASDWVENLRGNDV